MSRRHWSTAVVALLATACTVDPGVTATRSNQSAGGPVVTSSNGDPVTTAPTDYPLIEGVVDFGERGPAHPEYDGYLTAAFQDIQDFWSEAYPEVYDAPWQPLSGGIFAGYAGRQAPIPGCDPNSEANTTYQDIQEGTAFYCPLGDFVAYDDEERLPQLVQQLGREAVAVVFAHELGHAVQARAGEFDQPGVLMEQQADCFAGAWVARVASGASDVIRFDDNGIRAGLVAMLNVADPVMTDGSDPLSLGDAHGTGFDRVGAFQDGFIGGAQRCKSFFTEGRINQLIDLPFDITDQNAGNLPLYDPTGGGIDIVTLIPAGLDQYWTALMSANSVDFTPPVWQAFTGGNNPSCDGIDAATFARNVVYCAADNTIYWDEDYAGALAEGAGDMALGYLFSNAYSDAVQTALGSQRSGESRQLLDACLTGVWTAWTIPAEADKEIRLSAGDLDEALVIAIERSDRTADANINGSAFETTDAFRSGVLGGLAQCQTDYP